MKKDFVITEENVALYAERIGQTIKEKCDLTKANGFVLGMSGGVDCSVVARLCQIANVPVRLYMMPYGESMSESYPRAIELINKFGFESEIFNIKQGVDAVTIPVSSDDTALNEENIKLARANIRPRVRMTLLYQFAQLRNSLVIGTGNLSEITVGYFTKWGDGACDFNPLALITKREVYILAKYLGVPECIINAKPSAELFANQTDEGEMGFTYQQLDDFILNGTSGDVSVDYLIKKINVRTQHKRDPISIFEG